jgi:Tol biopolymer transport system component
VRIKDLSMMTGMVLPLLYRARISRLRTSMSRIRFRLAFLSLTVAATQAAAQRSAGQTVPRFHSKILATDTLQISSPVLSPDRKWVVYHSYEFARSNLWVVPAAGGQPKQLTSGDHADLAPHWFPSGDRIAFWSDRTKSMMVLDFDKATGTAVGTPRRVTLEEGREIAITPDGSRIAYFTSRVPDGALLKLVPATGGKATTIAEIPADLVLPANLSFSPDGAWIYFAAMNYTKRLSSLYRVAASGGKPMPVNPNLTFASNAMVVFPVPAEQQVIVLQRVPKKGTVLTFTGDTVSTFTLMQSAGDIGRAPMDTKNYLLVYGNVVSPTRLVGLDGRARTIGNATIQEWPVSWSRDGKRILVSPSASEIAIINVDGSGRTVESITPKNVSIPQFKAGHTSSDWRYMTLLSDSGRLSPTQILYIYDRETKSAREITRRAARTSFITANGDWFGTNHGEFVYLEDSGDRVDIHGVKPTGENRVIRSFPREIANKAEFGIDGDKIAYQTLTGDSASLFVIAEANGEPKRLMTIHGRFEELVWSPDTKTIAAFATTGSSAGTPTAEMIFVPVANPSQSRSIPLGDGGYETVWSPDSRAVFFLKADKGWTKTSVWRYPVRADEPARNVTQNETSMIWGYQLSPDGSVVALPAEQNRGSSLWRVDLTQAATAYREAKAKGTP